MIVVAGQLNLQLELIRTTKCLVMASGVILIAAGGISLSEAICRVNLERPLSQATSIAAGRDTIYCELLTAQRIQAYDYSGRLRHISPIDANLGGVAMWVNDRDILEFVAFRGGRHFSLDETGNVREVGRPYTPEQISTLTKFRSVGVEGGEVELRDGCLTLIKTEDAKVLTCGGKQTIINLIYAPFFVICGIGMILIYFIKWN